MPQVEVETEAALHRHPERVEEIMAKMNDGQSRSVGQPPEAFQWEYMFFLRIGSYSFQEVLDKLQQKDPSQDPRDQVVEGIQTRVENLKNRCQALLMMSRQGTTWRSDQLLETVPPEVEEYLRDMAIRNYEADLETAQLSDQELAQRSREAIARLRQMSGSFTAVSFKPHKQDSTGRTP